MKNKNLTTELEEFVSIENYYKNIEFYKANGFDISKVNIPKIIGSYNEGFAKLPQINWRNFLYQQ